MKDETMRGGEWQMKSRRRRCDRSGVEEVEASEDGVDKCKCLLEDRDRAGRTVRLQQHTEYQ